MTILLEPFEFAFFTRALVAVILIGALCGALGGFVLLRGLSYIGQGLSQSVLGGVAVSMALGLGLYTGAAVATAVATLLIDRVRRRRGLYADAAIGIVTLSLFAVGVAVISANRSREFNVTNVLFGNVLGVKSSDLLLVGAVTAMFFLVLATQYKPLLFTTFDPVVARSHGIRTGLMDALFNLCLAAVVVVSLRVLGVLLIAAALIIPAATARMATRSFAVMLPLSVALGVVGGVVGLYLSYYVDIASGPAVVLVHAALFTVTAVTTAVLNRVRGPSARLAGAAPAR